MITFRSALRHAHALLAIALGLVAFANGMLVEAAIPSETVRIHYHRDGVDYAGWVVYVFGDGAANPSPSFPGNQGPVGTDAFGVFFDVAVRPDATFLNFILTNGGTKNCPNDMRFDFNPPGAAVKFGSCRTTAPCTPQYLHSRSVTSTRPKRISSAATPLPGRQAIPARPIDFTMRSMAVLRRRQMASRADNGFH